MPRELRNQNDAAGALTGFYQAMSVCRFCEWKDDGFDRLE